ncbi:NADH dehydrogenase, alpha subcomplex, subunit 2 [Amniculicola lignicola CBS 123094]|uniref:NADH dehydrogenase, alpha subcomplex, subunit 2 n=1 Tax=Amniculicola lignicola CBS 123094 TaxID=1392246 RepID=A0A6A5W550_9PLEO|nr:NADH dehydrogenase, alpha subcomplex, subunit 2 [Amniculicola lignicola CBS 123094]
MATKYGFAKSLKEIRFLFCQTSEQSAATRYSAGPSFPSSPSFPPSLPPSFPQQTHHTAHTPHTPHPPNTQTPRTFLSRTYPTMKKHNPHTPIMLREARGTEPKVYARYEFGKEKVLALKDLDDKAIEAQVTDLVRTSV